MIEGPEVEAHRHRTGHGFADLILAVTAVLLSCVSVYIAVQHGRTMERLVAANSWPNLSIGSSNLDEAGHRDITLDVQNTGVGPARIDSVELFYKGKPMPSAAALIAECCNAKKINFTSSRLRGEVLPAREIIHPVQVTPDMMGEDVWKALERERAHVVVRICYCSVFDECFVRDTKSRRPVPVRECTPSQAVEFAADPTEPTD
jgi:hypothetical protein